MTRVAIVDDHPVVREGLVAALDGKGGIEVTGVFGRPRRRWRRG